MMPLAPNKVLHMQTVLKSGSVVMDATCGSIKGTNIKEECPSYIIVKAVFRKQ